jgi:hypothetical protein
MATGAGGPALRARARASCARYLSTAADHLNDWPTLQAQYATSHLLGGALSAIAECQRAFPDLLVTHAPSWVQTLDTAPFI